MLLWYLKDENQEQTTLQTTATKTEQSWCLVSRLALVLEITGLNICLLVLQGRLPGFMCPEPGYGVFSQEP